MRGRLGEDIWKEASAEAAAAEARTAKEKQEAEAAMDVLSTIGSVAGALGAGAGAPGSSAPNQAGAGQSAPSQAHCCINRQYFDCPTPGGLRRACGELSACMVQCMSQSSMDCPDKCLKDHLLDVSECNRDVQRDKQCSQDR